MGTSRTAGCNPRHPKSAVTAIAAPAVPSSAYPTTMGERSARFVWWVCVVLLFASSINYANRFALTQNPLQVQREFHTNKEGYGRVTGAFAQGFAIGGLSFGILADIVSVRWLFPCVVLAWSAAGVASGLVNDLDSLTWAQFCLGFFEAGHWPCSLRTTQRLLRPHQRTLGNSILQSGASLGAVFTPLLVLGLYLWDPAQWRLAFFICGGLGVPWVILWLASVREADLRQPVIQTDEVGRGIGEQRQLQDIPFFHVFLLRRFWVLLFVVVTINLLWHYVRVWLADTLEGDLGFSTEVVQLFTAFYYLVTMCGSLASGWLSARLVHGGVNVFRARLMVFLTFGLLSSVAAVAAFMPRGPLFLIMLLPVAFGSLGLFPVYYSMNQEISARHQGKVGGMLGFIAWISFGFLNPYLGRLVDQDPGIRPFLFATIGLAPLLGFIVLALGWGKRAPAKEA